jgi:outer membrane protein OmpA-like peptidoglycan-associated protein
MLQYFKLIALISFGYLNAQGRKVETVFFGFDKSSLEVTQQQTILDFIIQADTSQIESVQIYGYCDDRGNYDYNYKLSEDRVNTVRNILTSNGFNKNKIVIVEGKGRVILTDNGLDNLAEIRSKNRRVDILLVPKNSFGKGIYNSIQKKHIVGDHIYFENILFTLGRSALSLNSKKELDRIVDQLQKNKNIEFEIRGHVCCTPSNFEDAIDIDTNERKLSFNRAKTVFLYLKSKNISSLRMTYRGCGNKFPLGKGEDVDRRVEFLITKV